MVESFIPRPQVNKENLRVAGSIDISPTAAGAVNFEGTPIVVLSSEKQTRVDFALDRAQLLPGDVEYVDADVLRAALQEVEGAVDSEAEKVAIKNLIALIQAGVNS